MRLQVFGVRKFPKIEVTLIDGELSAVTDPRVTDHIRSLLVPPEPQMRDWDYGEPDEAYPCWIVLADKANARMGLDGEGFYFYANGNCAWAWSPDPGSKPQRLADIFQDLKTQSLLPTRLVQLFW